MSESWCLVVPVKRLALAKTRLAPFAGAHRENLALAFALDTVAAALRCPQVTDVLAVCDDVRARDELQAVGATLVGDEPDSGLNPALAHGAQVARDRHPELGVGALSADLPALRASDLTQALNEARAVDTAFVADAAGSGTTCLLAAPHTVLAPRFGPGSAAAHRGNGVFEVTSDVPSLRRDVDTVSDLIAAGSLGVGPRTVAVLAALEFPGG